MLVVTNSINTEFIKGLAPDRNLDKKIGVFDIETLRSTDSNGRVVFVPYLICILDRPVVGDNHKEGLMFYLNDYFGSSEDLMFKDAFRSMLRRKYNGFTFT